jgi:cyclic beta-1,2-glucan synthetase
MVQDTTRIGPDLSTRNSDLATVLAVKLIDSTPRKTIFPVRERLKKLKDFFQAAYTHFEAAAKTQVVLSVTSEWLLDNFFIIEQAVRVVAEDLPADYYARLPKTADGWPRIYLVTQGFHHHAPRPDLEQIRHFTQTFQQTTPLRVGEVWALPLMLRLTILETLADGLAEFTKLEWDPASDPALWGELKDILDTTTPDPETKVINSILNLRLIATLDWKGFFEATSVLEQILRRDPADVYARSEFDTRNEYRGIVEDLAHGSSLGETAIAEEAIRLAESTSTPRERHIGYYLIAEGRPLLEKAVNFRPSPDGYILRLLRHYATFIYIGSIALLSILILYVIFRFTSLVTLDSTLIITAVLLSILPASAIAIELINWLVILLVPPRRLPKLDLTDGVPPEFRTMVVIPALFGTQRDVSFLLRQIENHFVANNDPNISFALLTDFADAPEKNMPQDEELIATASKKIDVLN